MAKARWKLSADVIATVRSVINPQSVHITVQLRLSRCRKTVGLCPDNGVPDNSGCTLLTIEIAEVAKLFVDGGSP